MNEKTIFILQIAVAILCLAITQVIFISPMRKCQEETYFFTSKYFGNCADVSEDFEITCKLRSNDSIKEVKNEKEICLEVLKTKEKIKEEELEKFYASFNKN